MYNGIGLASSRGSGTSGYVQKNFAYLKPKANDMRNKRAAGEDESELTKKYGIGAGSFVQKNSNPELLLHEQKRALELELVSL